MGDGADMPTLENVKTCPILAQNTKSFGLLDPTVNELMLFHGTHRGLRRASDAPVTGSLKTPLGMPTGSLNGR